MLRRLVAALVACALLGGAEAAWSRPFTVEDLLHQESLGAAAIDPSGRWLVFEQRDPYDTADRYEHHFATSQSLGRLRVVDLRQAPASRPLLVRDPGPGMVMGPFSPSGARLAVYWMHGRRWTLGVVTLATGDLRLFDLTPDEVRRGRALQWLSDRELLVTARPDELPPADTRSGWRMAERLHLFWDATARGEGSHTVLGSGAYAAVRARPAPKQLLRVDAATGARRVLASGPIIDFEVAPEGRHVALFESGPDVQPRADGPVRGAAGFETEATRLAIVDLATGARTEPCPGLDALPQLLAWSPSGRALLVFGRGSDGLWTSGHFVRVDAGTGRAQSLSIAVRPAVEFNPVTVRAGWLGEDPVVYARAVGEPGARADWFRARGTGWVSLTRRLASPDGAIAAFDRESFVLIAAGRAWRIDDVGRTRPASAAGLAPALSASRAPEGGRLRDGPQSGTWVSRGASPSQTLSWLDGEGAHLVMALSGGGGDLVAASAAGRAAVFRDVDGHGVETLRLERPTGPPVTIATLNRGLAATDPPRIEAFHHLGARGEPLSSWLFLPPTASDGRPPPLIVRPYIGYSYPKPPRDLYMEQGFFQNLRMLTGHGYAVLVPSLPNAPEGMTDPAQGVADRILAVMDAAARDPRLAGAFDPNRAAVLGWSFGGYTTMATITQTDRFRAAVAMDGVSDLVAYWAHLAPGRLIEPEEGYGSNLTTGGVEATQPALGGPPWKDPERYARNSPLLFTDKIHTPLLLIHGAQDGIPLAGSEAIYSALFRQNKDALFVIYWGANHAVTSPGDVRDVYERTFRFLDEHLGPISDLGPPSPNRARGPASDAPRPPPTLR
jgi:dipeptidyl aminopeptidase/acylaminoacyl peptidase